MQDVVRLRGGARVGRDVGRGCAHGRDVVDGAAALIFLVERVESDEVLLRVRSNLRGRPRDDKVSRDAAPVTLSKLGQAEEKQTVFLLRPGDTLSSLLVGGLRGGRLGLLLARGRGGSRRRGRGRRRAKGIVLVVRQGNAPGFDVFDILLFVEGEVGEERRDGVASARGVRGRTRRATTREEREKWLYLCAFFFSTRHRRARESAGEGNARARTWRRLKRLFRPIILLPGIVAVLNWRFEGRGAGGVSARRRGRDRLS